MSSDPRRSGLVRQEATESPPVTPGVAVPGAAISVGVEADSDEDLRVPRPELTRFVSVAQPGTARGKVGRQMSMRETLLHSREGQ